MALKALEIIMHLILGKQLQEMSISAMLTAFNAQPRRKLSATSQNQHPDFKLLSFFICPK